MKFPRSLSAILVLLLAAVACGQSTEALPTAAAQEDTPVPATSAPVEAVEPTATENPVGVPEKSDSPQSAAELPDPDGYTWVKLVTGLVNPDFVTNAGDGRGRLFAIEQDGRIRVIENGALLVDPFLDIDGKVGSSGNEQGLLGLAFHPDYANNGYFYVNYTDNAGDTVIARYQVSGEANQADPDSEKVLLQVHQPYSNHNGGALAFGPDGMLYLGLGDGGSQGDPAGNAQSLNAYLGKVLRIDVDSGDPYGIPADNPFAGGGGLPEVWAYGLRNPWRFSFDALTGDLYIGDVGQNQWEEIDMLPAGVGGINLGWNYFEGTHAYQGSAPADAELVAPVAEYDHSNRCSVTGGYVYRGSQLPAWQGVYLYADYCSGEVFGLLQHADGSWEDQLLFPTQLLITSFGVDEAGEIYLVARNGGIYQLQAR